MARAAALSAAFFAGVCALGSAYVWQHTPERLSVTEDSGIEVPFTGIQARYTGQEEQSVFGEKGATTQVEYSFLGIVPVKTVTAEKQEQPMVETGANRLACACSPAG